VNAFRRGKSELWRVVSGEVDLVLLPKWMVQDRQWDRIRVRNYFVSTRGRIWQLSELVAVETGSLLVADAVLHETRKVRTSVAGTNTHTRPLAKFVN